MRVGQQQPCGGSVADLGGVSSEGPQEVNDVEVVDESVSHLDEDLGEIRELNDELARQNQALKREIDALKSDDDYVEQVIKDELGWVRADELVLIFPEKH